MANKDELGAFRGLDFPSAILANNLTIEARNENQLSELQTKKKAARDALVAARAEMRRIDAELIENGASGLDLVLVCW